MLVLHARGMGMDTSHLELYYLDALHLQSLRMLSNYGLTSSSLNTSYVLSNQIKEDAKSINTILKYKNTLLEEGIATNGSTSARENPPRSINIGFRCENTILEDDIATN